MKNILTKNVVLPGTVEKFDDFITTQLRNLTISSLNERQKLHLFILDCDYKRKNDSKVNDTIRKQ